MYNIVRHTVKFDTDSTAELLEYDAILNDPLCSILSERREKLREELREGIGDDQTINVSEKMILVVTWEQKTLS